MWKLTRLFYSNYLDRMDESLLLIKYVEKTLCFRDSRVFFARKGWLIRAGV